MLVVLLVLVWLYVGPARSYFAARSEAAQRHAEVAALAKQHRELKARRDELQHDAALEREARELGMVRQGERSFVVRGLPK